ncbi:phenylalanine--tRNA ligase subunit beta, partial [Candidatus Uhrbacteria bacterium]|nr:phenylalanine--tRNA ligase subunit beta [Candidatus Uhrbacteria bacterium]
LDDVVLEVEITTNRPDAMGIVGLAREVGAIFNVPLKIENRKWKIENRISKNRQLIVKVEVPKLCPRYIAVVMDAVKVASSPWWIQRRLMASGVRPINNIVDITNYVLLEYGQPTHVFDYAKLKRQNEECKILVRLAKKGETIMALDGNTYELDDNILVIADAERPIAIAGIMGGEETGVRAGTTRIVYEIANFDALTIRRGEHQIGLTSASSVRFNKGLPVQLPEFAAARLIALTREIAGGEVVAFKDSPSFRKGLSLKIVKISPQDVVKKIGVEIPTAQMKKYLESLGFKVSGGSKKWSVVFPYWRSLEADGTADIAEEVARMYGYHKILGILPQGDLSGELPNPQFAQEYAVKEILRGAGFTEAYTYSFVAPADLEHAGFNVQDALALVNPLSTEMTHMRPWLGISMLKAVAQNEKQRDREHLFEISSEYHLVAGNLPQERQKLMVLSAGRENHEGEHFYAVKGVAEHLAGFLDLPDFSYEKVGTTHAPWVKHYHPARVLLVKCGRDILGVVGELHPSLLRSYGIEHRVAFLEWEMRTLYSLIGQDRRYSPPLPYPSVKRDIALVVSKEVEYAKLHAAIAKVDQLVHAVELFDQYEGKGVPEGQRSLAFHISYASSQRTLTGEEADKVHEKLGKMLEKQFGAKIRD